MLHQASELPKLQHNAREKIDPVQFKDGRLSPLREAMR